VGLKTEGKERKKEVWSFFERCSLLFLNLLAIHVCGDLLLMDDLCAYSKCFGFFSGETGRWELSDMVVNIPLPEFQSHPG